MRPHGLQHTRLPCPSTTPGACSNSCPSSQRCHPTIPSSVVPFFSCLQSFPASRSFQMSQFFASGSQSIGISASSISPSNEYSGLISFRMAGWISFQSKGLSRVFSNTTVQKHQFFSAQLSLESNSHIHWRREWQSTPVFLPGESHGQRSLAGYSPQGRKGLDMTKAT